MDEDSQHYGLEFTASIIACPEDVYYFSLVPFSRLSLLPLSVAMVLSAVDPRGVRHILTSQHSLPGIPVALKHPIDLRTSMDGKYKEIAEVRDQYTSS